MKKSIELDPGRIRYWRKQRGLTQQALGDAVLDSGKPPSRLRRIQAWERTGRVWDRLAADLASALDVTLADLEPSDADIAGLWLCWSERSLPPRSATLLGSLHGAFDHVRAQIQRARDAHEHLQVRLVDADALFRIELFAGSSVNTTSLQPIFLRRVRWSERHGLLWRKPSTLERDGLQRLFDEAIDCHSDIKPGAVYASR